MKQLESRIELFHNSPNSESTPDGLDTLLKLYKLAALVYLERASTNLSGSSEKLDRWIDDAFSIMESMEICHQPFIIFLFGCEAHSDERRIFILELIQRTRDTMRRSLTAVHRMIQAVWLQGDLSTDREVGYLAKLKVVFGSSSIVPSLA